MHVGTIEEALLEVETTIGAGEGEGAEVEVVHGVAAEIDTIPVATETIIIGMTITGMTITEIGGPLKCIIGVTMMVEHSGSI